MKIAVLSESPADETVVRVFVDALLGKKTQVIAGLALRTRGWPSTLTDVPRVLRYLYYGTEAEAFVVVADANHSPVHVESGDEQRPCDERCRLCQLRRAVNQVQSFLTLRPGRTRVKTAVGLAVPALEAWFRCGRDPQVSEATWIEGLQAKREPYTKNALKQLVYGTDRPSVQLARQRGVEEARRLAQDLAALENRFPVGFGALAGDIRGWRSA